MSNETISNSGFTFNRGADLVFVGGSPRSGTTLVQNILDCHPDIAGGPEFDRIPDIVELRNNLHMSIDNGRIDVFLSKESVDKEIGIFVERVFSPYLQKRGRRILSEKTPWNVLHFQTLLKIFPDARFIFCVRDPRAVAASMLQVGERAKKKSDAPGFTRSVWQAIKTINSCNRAGFSALRDSDRVMLVCYEKLVRSPEQMTKQICQFLNIPWSHHMLAPGENRHDGEVALDNVWYDQKMYYRNPDASRLDAWKTELSLLCQILVTAAFENNHDLINTGYKLFDETLPLSTRTGIKAASSFYNAKRWFLWRTQQIRSICASRG